MPRIVDVQLKRSDLVRASGEVIARRGLEGATLKLIASAAGCTTGMLTHYFEDRDALLIETLRAVHLAAGRRMVAAAARIDDPALRLGAILLEALPLNEERRREWRVWVAFWRSSLGDAALATENARRTGEWTAFVEDALRPLGGGPTDALGLTALVDGLGLRLCLFTGAPPDRRDLEATCLGVLERSLLAVGGRLP